MKLIDLRNRSWQQQMEMLECCESLSLRNVVIKPRILKGKILAFVGNYAVFATQGLCLRLVEYNAENNNWNVADVDLSDMLIEEFNWPFRKNELIDLFDKSGIRQKGFLLDK